MIGINDIGISVYAQDRIWVFGRKFSDTFKVILGLLLLCHIPCAYYDTCNDGIFVVVGVVKYIHIPSAADILGYSVEESIDMNIRDISEYPMIDEQVIIPIVLKEGIWGGEL
ncbi:hypothetical protein MBAV_003572, partial [Candidatus Magnetobacterium bavaricum]